MELKTSKGTKVLVNAQREAVFADDSVSVHKISLNGANRAGILTGMILAGFCEVEMPGLDGKKHWYPVDGIAGERGEKFVEEEIVIVEDGEEPEAESD